MIVSPGVSFISNQKVCILVFFIIFSFYLIISITIQNLDHNVVLNNILMGPLGSLFSANHSKHFIGNSSARAASYWHSWVIMLAYISMSTKSKHVLIKPQDQRKGLLHGDVESWEWPSLLQRFYLSSPTDFAHRHPDFRPRSNLSEARLLQVSPQTPETEFTWTGQRIIQTGLSHCCTQEEKSSMSTFTWTVTLHKEVF